MLNKTNGQTKILLNKPLSLVNLDLPINGNNVQIMYTERSAINTKAAVRQPRER